MQKKKDFARYKGYKYRPRVYGFIAATEKNNKKIAIYKKRESEKLTSLKNDLIYSPRKDVARFKYLKVILYRFDKLAQFVKLFFYTTAKFVESIKYHFCLSLLADQTIYSSHI